jgi:hypothetical protein
MIDELQGSPSHAQGSEGAVNVQDFFVHGSGGSGQNSHSPQEWVVNVYWLWMFETMDVYGQNSHENYVWTIDLWTMDYLCTMEGCECVLWIVYFACESVYVNCDIVNCVFCC